MVNPGKFWCLVFLSCVVLGNYGLVGAKSERPQTEQPFEPEIGVITAFTPEVFAVLAKLSSSNGNDTSGVRPFFFGTLSGKKVVITLSGVGMTNGAMTTQHLIDKFPSVQKILFTGIAGGINPANKLGEMLICRRWAQYMHQKFVRPMTGGNGEKLRAFVDFGVDFPGKFLRDESGDVISFKLPRDTDGSYAASAKPTDETKKVFEDQGAVVADGFAIPMQVEVLKNEKDAFAQPVPQTFWFDVDPTFISVAESLAPTITLEKSGKDANGDDFTLDPAPEVRVVDNCMSASTFVDNADFRKAVFENLKGELVDMETAAFMHVCASNGVACGAIQSVSDLAGGEEDFNVINNFLSLAAANIATVLEKLIEKL